MNKIARLSNNLLVFGVPILLVISMILITRSKFYEVNPSILSIGISIDLLFTIPLIYYTLIRKKNIPKTTSIPLSVVGMIIGFYSIPLEHQFILQWVKTWIFPFVEIGIAIYVLYNVRKAIKKYKINATQRLDFFSILKKTCAEILPTRIASLLAMELAICYYGFIYWKKRALQKNEYSYHKNNGTISLLVAFIGIIGIETYILHIFLSKWSIIAAWVASILSIYSSIQIFGFLKSILKRPISIDKNTLYLRYGILNETQIDLHAIESVEISTKDIEFNSETRKLSPLGELEGHNIIITLNKVHILTGLYGTSKTFKTIAFFIDNKAQFKTELEEQIRLLKL
ncbi:hypothetical protein [Aquimarina longa]|uniref:hypothetical protein n=1 Tax=Aquimarina longa TaxID=1080221 RepID=UPI000782E08B|nr:hypothetical protein [Aquimarina longa]